MNEENKNLSAEVEKLRLTKEKMQLEKEINRANTVDHIKSEAPSAISSWAKKAGMWIFWAFVAYMITGGLYEWSILH